MPIMPSFNPLNINERVMEQPKNANALTKMALAIMGVLQEYKWSSKL